MESQTVLTFLQGVNCDIPDSVNGLLPTLPERKGEIIFIIQEGIKILNSFLRILCETDPNIKGLGYQELLESFVDFVKNKFEESEDSIDNEDSEDEDSEDEDSEDEDSEDESVESFVDKINKMPLNDLLQVLRDFFSIFEINNLSFAVFSSNEEIEFFPSEIHDPNNIFCIFKDREEINPLYFQEAERRLIFEFLLER